MSSPTRIREADSAMKIKLNQLYSDHSIILERLTLEFPELNVKVKERKWGGDKPSFKYKKKLYEFDHIDDLMNQVKKIVRLKDDYYGKKLKNQVKDVEPLEDTRVNEKIKVLEDQFN